MNKPKTKEKLIKPEIICNNEKHPLEALLESGDMPVLEAHGIRRLSKSNNSWVHYVVKFNGDKILEIIPNEPDLKAIAVEAYKMKAQLDFIDAKEDEI